MACIRSDKLIELLRELPEGVWIKASDDPRFIAVMSRSMVPYGHIDIALERFQRYEGKGDFACPGECYKVATED